MTHSFGLVQPDVDPYDIVQQQYYMHRLGKFPVEWTEQLPPWERMMYFRLLQDELERKKEAQDRADSSSEHPKPRPLVSAKGTLARAPTVRSRGR